MARYSRLLTVSVAASDPALVALATAKDELDISDSTLDTRLNRWIKETSTEITSYIGRALREETVTETFRSYAWGAETQVAYVDPDSRLTNTILADPAVAGLSLRRYPITLLSLITEDGISLVDGTDYEADLEAGIVYRLSGSARIPWYAQMIAVTYSGGYATADDVPYDIQKACLMALKHRYAAQSRDPLLRRSFTPGVLEQEWSTTAGKTDTGLPADALDVIDRYRDVHT